MRNILFDFYSHTCPVFFYASCFYTLNVLFPFNLFCLILPFFDCQFYEVLIPQPTYFLDIYEVVYSFPLFIPFYLFYLPGLFVCVFVYRYVEEDLEEEQQVNLIQQFFLVRTFFCSSLSLPFLMPLKGCLGYHYRNDSLLLRI